MQILLDLRSLSRSHSVQGGSRDRSSESRVIKNLAQTPDFERAPVVKPLTSLTAGYPPRRKGCKVNLNDSKYLDPKQPFGGRWSDACQRAFENIIEKLTSSPMLGYADQKLPYFLHTDASTTGLGAALYQEQGGTTRVIAYASRGLSRSDSRYPAHKLRVFGP